jgi:hypothetical protein
MDDTIKAGRRMINKTRSKGMVLICALVFFLLSFIIPNHAAVAAVASCQDLPVRIAGTTPAYFSTLQSAYNSAADRDVIQGLAVTFTENIILDRNISVTFDGGYDCGYTSHIGKSAVKGTLHDNSGKLTIGNFVIASASPDSTFVIASSTSAGGAISPSGTTSVSQGGSQVYAITPNSGYAVAQVLVDGASVGIVSSYTFTNVTANHTIAASFMANAYTITATAGANGTISPSGIVSVIPGGTGIFTITPNTGYHVSDVVVDTVSVGTPTVYIFNNVTANHTIAASFVISTYTITAIAGSGGSISPAGAVVVNYGDSQSFTITPNTGYHVTDVKVDGVSQGAITGYPFINVIANHTISATFVADANTITLTIDTPSDGTTISRPDIMVKGTVTNAGGYETGVSVNGVAANVYGNEFVANHVPLQEGSNVITVTAADINGGTSTVSITVTAVTTGKYIRLTADTESGVAPLVTKLRIDGTFSIANSLLNSTGPTQPEILSSSADQYRVKMTTEGLYYFTASVTGPDGNLYQDTIGVAATNMTALDNLLRGKWSAMTTSLNSKNIATALTYISTGTKAKYQQMFNAIIDQLPAMVATQTEFNFVSFKDSAATFELVTSESGGVYSYEVIFVKDANGLWLIQDF